MSCHYPDSGHDWCAAIEDRSFWFDHRNRFLVEVMRRFPPVTPLYDVGGGNGVVAAALKREGIRAIVVEPGAAGAQRAKDRGLESIRATIEEAGLKPGTVPSIGLFDVVEHIEDPIAFLSTCRRMMQPGGRIYVAVPAYETLWSVEDDFAQHFRRYTSGRLRRELTDAGFEVEYTTYMFALLLVPILLMRAIPYRLGVTQAPSKDTTHADHAVGGIARSIMDAVHAAERVILKALGALPFGASVVAVAKNPVGDR